MYEKNETLKTACGSPCYAAPEVSSAQTALFQIKLTQLWKTNAIVMNLDDCWKTISWPTDRYLVKWGRLLRNGCRLSPLRRPQDVESIQENHGRWLSDAQVLVSRVQRFRAKDTKYRSRDAYSHLWHQESPIYEGCSQRSNVQTTGARPFPRSAKDALHKRSINQVYQRLLIWRGVFYQMSRS